MAYYYECPRCTEVHPFNVVDGVRLDVGCETCGVEGCRKCMPDDLCADCSPSEAPAPVTRVLPRVAGCLACLNGWSH